MRAFGYLLVLSLLHAPLISAEAYSWQPPAAVPAGCVQPQFRLILLDVSLGMARDGRFDAAKRRIMGYIEHTPACTLIVVGTFGTTADALAGRFVTSARSRSRLEGTVEGLRASQDKADPGEAAKLIEWLSNRLRNTYGQTASQLVVRVYSVPGDRSLANEQPASVGELLARRMSAQYMHLGVEADAAGTKPSIASAGPEVRSSASAGSPARRSWPSSVVVWVAGAGIALASLFLLFRVARRGRLLQPGESRFEAFLVVESLAAGESGEPAIVRPERRIEVALGVPAVFSTEPNAATFIAADIPGVSGGELFRIIPLPASDARVESSAAGLAINDVPLEGGRAVVFLGEPVRVRVGPRTFIISAVARRPRTVAHSGVFEAGAVAR